VGTAAAYSAWILVHILAASPELRVQYIPDDAYYYMTLARNFARQGRWTFDSGVSVTTGFHVLHAYALAALYYASAPAPERCVQIAVLVSWAAAVPAGIAAAVFVLRSRRLVPPLLFLLFVVSGNMAGNTISAMEWGWVVSLSAAYYLLFDRALGASFRGTIAALAVCGFLGNLARSDFGLLPLALAMVSLCGVRTLDGRRRFAAAAAGLAGALAGVLAVTLHNFIVVGEALQSSARMKSLWGAADGPSPRPFILTFLRQFGYPAPLTFRLCAVMAILVAVVGACAVVEDYRGFGPRRTRLDEVVLHRHCMWVASLLTLAGYVAFYAFNPTSAQPWYTANVIAPAFIFICLPVAQHRALRAVPWATAMILAVLLIRQAPSAAQFTSERPYAHQVSMFRAGHYLHDAGLAGRVGSWNAGIIGFYEGGHVVNLDGLVNNDVYAFAARNRLVEYIDRESIRYVVDFEAMVTSGYFRARGGYDEPSFLERLQPLRQFDDRTEGWNRLTLYRVLPPGTR
jgi:hypothetical protein